MPSIYQAWLSSLRQTTRRLHYAHFVSKPAMPPVFPRSLTSYRPCADLFQSLRGYQHRLKRNPRLNSVRLIKLRLYTDWKRSREGPQCEKRERLFTHMANANSRKYLLQPVRVHVRTLTSRSILSSSSIRSSVTRVPTQVHSRSISTSQRRQALPLILGGIKATSALKGVTTVARILLSIFPLSLRSRLVHLRHATRPTFFNSRAFLYTLLSLPPLLLIGLLTIYSRVVPLTGRRRVMLFDDEEEADIASGIIASARVASLPLQDAFKWYHILRKILHEEDVNNEPGTILGSQVLMNDWRTDWINHVLKGLESGLPYIADSKEIQGLEMPPAAARFDVQIPSSSAYSVLLIDSPHQNAFSFGWAPDTALPRGMNKKGVLCVFTGAIDSILGKDTKETPHQISDAETKQLAVLLSHELAHLILDHPLESYANSVLLFPQMQRMAIDIARTLAWPITFILGPFVNDSIFMSTSLLIQPDTDGKLPFDLYSACENRKMEMEADLISLRILASAGINPLEAVKFWETRTERNAASEHVQKPISSLKLLMQHSSDPEEARQSFLHSHPVDRSRLDRIKQELKRWGCKM